MKTDKALHASLIFLLAITIPIIVVFTLVTMVVQVAAEKGGPPSRWHQIGPYWGDRFQVIVDPGKAGRLYCIGHGSIHRSEDEGNTWKPIYNNEMSLGTFLSFAFSSMNNRTLFSGSSMTGFWRSDDGGDSWTRKVKGIPSFEINHPSANTRIRVWPSIVSIVSSRDALYIGLSSPHESIPLVYRSTDNGESWEPFSTGIKARRSKDRPAVCMLSLDRKDWLWAGVNGGGVYLLTGGQWENRSRNLPEKAQEITFILTDPVSNRVRIGTRRDWIYEAGDGGTSWSRLPFPDNMDLSRIPLIYWMAVDPNNPQLLWAGLSGSGTGVSNEQPIFVPDGDQGPGGMVVSLDSGRRWLWPVKSPYSGFRMTIDPNDTYSDTWGKRSRYYFKTAGGGSALMKSSKGGLDFRRSMKGMAGDYTNALLSDPRVPGRLYASSEGVVFTAERASQGEFIDWTPRAAAESLIYIWGFSPDYSTKEGVWYTCGEPAWKVKPAMGLYYLDPCDTGAVLREDMKNIQRPSPRHLKGTGLWCVATHPGKPQAIYAGGQDSGLHYSEDGGTSWHNIRKGLGKCLSVTSIVLSGEGIPVFVGVRESDGNLLAGHQYMPQRNESGGVFSPDLRKGEFMRCGDLQEAVYSIAVVRRNQERIVAAASSGIKISDDGGRTWKSTAKGTPAGLLCCDLKTAPGKEPVIYGAFMGGGVYKSSDRGDTWRPLNEGLLNLAVEEIVLDAANPECLYTASYGGSIYRLLR